MASPTDKDLERLRDYHDLDLTDVFNQEELENALNNTTSKISSKFSKKHRDNLKAELVANSDKWFDLSKTQNEVTNNFSSLTDKATSLDDIRNIPEIEPNVRDSEKIETSILKKSRQFITEVPKEPESIPILDDFRDKVDDIASLSRDSEIQLKSQIGAKRFFLNVRRVEAKPFDELTADDLTSTRILNSPEIAGTWDVSIEDARAKLEELGLR